MEGKRVFSFEIQPKIQRLGKGKTNRAVQVSTFCALRLSLSSGPDWGFYCCSGPTACSSSAQHSNNLGAKRQCCSISASTEMPWMTQRREGRKQTPFCLQNVSPPSTELSQSRPCNASTARSCPEVLWAPQENCSFSPLCNQFLFQSNLGNPSLSSLPTRTILKLLEAIH